MDPVLNKLPAVDAAIALLFAFEHHWRGTTEADRSAKLCCAAPGAAAH